MRMREILWSGLFCVTGAFGCGITMSNIVDPATGKSISVMQKDSLCTVELVGSSSYLMDSNTESCFLVITAIRSAALVSVDCAKLKRKYVPAAKCITWLDPVGAAPALLLPPPAALPSSTFPH